MSEQTLKKAMHQFIDDYFEKDFDTVNAIQVADDALIESLEFKTLSEEGRSINEVVDELESDVFPNILQSKHPRHFAFIPGPASDLSWFGEMMMGAYNVHASNWINSSGPYAIEKNLIRWAAAHIGFDQDKHGGLFVSGGSMANLTALVAARDAKTNFESRASSTVYVSDQTHHSVEKALLVIGYHHDQIRVIPSDEHYRMKTDVLRQTIQKDLSKGHRPCTIIASSGTTNTGSVDDIETIANIAQEHDIWLHVDGAFGASYLLLESQKEQFKGIDRADSVSWDGHKLLYQTYSSAMIIVKDKNTLLNSFSAEPEYLRDISINEKDNFASLGIELTRPARAIKLWVTLETLGQEEIKRRLQYGIDLSHYLVSVLSKNKHWEILSGPQFGVVNFRYKPASFSKEALDALNTNISKKMIDSGYAVVFTTQLEKQTVLRIATINHETTKEDIDLTIEKLEEIAQSLV